MKDNTDFVKSSAGFNVKSQHKSMLWKQALTTSASCLISISSGLTYGISATILPDLREDKTIHYNPDHESWIASVATLSMMIGSVSAGPILDRYGRKVSHILLGIPFIVGWIIIACANSTGIILFGRFITGLSSGGNRPVTLVYIGEIADPKIRSTALYAPGLMIPVGILGSHAIGYYLGWRISSIVFAVFAAASTVALLFLKESPLWLIANGRTTEGVEAFRWFRGTSDASELELRTVMERHSKKSDMSVSEILSVVCSKAFVKPMLILMIIMINSQLSGGNALTFYSQDVFKNVFSGNIDPFLMTMAMDCIRNIVSLLICIVGNLVPRKITCLISNFAITIFSFGLVGYFEVHLNDKAWIAVLCLVMYVSFSTVTSNTGWTFVPELLPTSARGLGAGFNSMFSYISLFVTVKTLPDIVEKYNMTGLFAFFATAPLICGLLISFTLPETNGKTLQSIENGFHSKNVETI